MEYLSSISIAAIYNTGSAEGEQLEFWSRSRLVDGIWSSIAKQLTRRKKVAVMGLDVIQDRHFRASKGR